MSNSLLGVVVGDPLQDKISRSYFFSVTI